MGRRCEHGYTEKGFKGDLAVGADLSKGKTNAKVSEGKRNVSHQKQEEEVSNNEKWGDRSEDSEQGRDTSESGTIISETHEDILSINEGSLWQNLQETVDRAMKMNVAGSSLGKEVDPEVRSKAMNYAPSGFPQEHGEVSDARREAGPMCRMVNGKESSQAGIDIDLAVVCSEEEGTNQMACVPLAVIHPSQGFMCEMGQVGFSEVAKNGNSDDVK
ncbi:hypothetical protein F0562_013438 [Nyssa sinensis]|uniref:Uncharacterized protein n=1 Tax=Nyssa sinensis TaxID=561372 RepID=A0A5J4ZNX4_9ASTE|nr:hypothetical protein F0562_013438 [Nyssa sinensis]